MINDQIIYNAIRTPDGTVLASQNRHDCKVHIDTITGEEYMVDGGRDYLRRNMNNIEFEELSVYLTDSHIVNRVWFHWGTFGPQGRNPIEYKPLMVLDTDHIEAILETQWQIPPYIRKLFESELAWRKALVPAVPLPPDPDNQNNDRALWAKAAVTAFMNETGAEAEYAISDLLCDLQHFCDRYSDDYEEFGAALQRATGHYDAETLGDTITP